MRIVPRCKIRTLSYYTERLPGLVVLEIHAICPDGEPPIKWDYAFQEGHISEPIIRLLADICTKGEVISTDGLWELIRLLHVGNAHEIDEDDDEDDDA